MAGSGSSKDPARARALLEAMPGWASLAREHREALAALATVEGAPAGTWLFREGDPSDRVYWVASGRVTLTLGIGGRPEAAVLTVGPGEILGWSGLRAGGRRVASGRVAEAVELLSWPSDALADLCERDHHVGYAVMRLAFLEVARRLEDTRVQVLDVFGRRDA